MDKRTIAGVQVSTGSYDDFVDRIISLAADRVSSYVCLMNVHMFVEAYLCNSFKNIVGNADIVTPDGKPIAWALRLLDQVSQERVAGMDLLPSLLDRSNQACLSVYFYGGTSEMLKATRDYVKKTFPGLEVAGYHSPPFRALTEEEERESVKRINDSKANIVFVVLGCPKQEKWMASMKGKINAVLVGVGGALPVMIGLQKRAPKWMQNVGMEWFYRLQQEPGRLFKRYAVTNSVFLYITSVEILKKRLTYKS